MIGDTDGYPRFRPTSRLLSPRPTRLHPSLSAHRFLGGGGCLIAAHRRPPPDRRRQGCRNIAGRSRRGEGWGGLFARGGSSNRQERCRTAAWKWIVHLPPSCTAWRICPAASLTPFPHLCPTLPPPPPYQVRSLANGFGLPVLGTSMGRGLMPDEHPLCVNAARWEMGAYTRLLC